MRNHKIQSEDDENRKKIQQRIPVLLGSWFQD